MGSHSTPPGCGNRTRHLCGLAVDDATRCLQTATHLLRNGRGIPELCTAHGHTHTRRIRCTHDTRGSEVSITLVHAVWCARTRSVRSTDTVNKHCALATCKNPVPVIADTCPIKGTGSASDKSYPPDSEPIAQRSSCPDASEDASTFLSPLTERLVTDDTWAECASRDAGPDTTL